MNYFIESMNKFDLFLQEHEQRISQQLGELEEVPAAPMQNQPFEVVE